MKKITRTISIFFVALAALAAPAFAFSDQPEQFDPTSLYEIKESPSTGFFQYVISASVEENTDSLFVIAGPPDGIEVYYRMDGLFKRQISLPASVGAKDRVVPCAGRIWFLSGGKLLEIDRKNKAVTPANPPSPLPERIGEILCDSSERLIVTDADGKEIRRYDKKGAQDLQIGGSQIAVVDKQTEKQTPVPMPYKKISYITTDQFGRIFIFDAVKCAVFPFDQKARALPSLPKSDFQDVSFPCDSPSFAVDADRNLWFINSLQNSIDGYDSFGTLKKRIYANTDTGPRFITPSRIFIDSKNRLYVIDRASASIKVFDLNRK